MPSVAFCLSAIAVAAGFDENEPRNAFRKFERGTAKDVVKVHSVQIRYTSLTCRIPHAGGRKELLNMKRHGLTLHRLELPSKFDAREKFKECSDIIGHVRDQSNCGGCVAMAVIGVFNDRLCIKTSGKFNKLLSPGYAVACCTPDKGCEPPTGCSGATAFEVWGFAQRYGIPTGGDYKPAGLMDKADGCWPYDLPQCDHTYKGGKYPPCPKGLHQTPFCSSSCRNGKYPTPLHQDLHFVAPPGEIRVGPEVDKIKQEIFTNGPVTATFNAYKDFKEYTSGVYKHKYGELLGNHCVKLIGWGKTATEEYWLAVNSWNEGWGESGLIRIAIGQCKIESEVTYGVPKLPI
ncbi:hypothetical protein FOL47_010858 [Perkinsus chesapeaki]|uniref:Peptidase C1A papain C-terminal domain-containing protein n=1 Tax=Perkinsus chesapeaki TaxID=330153 RepID=A0A7J6L1N1_PERCH|nr:hypothetical protein FOL47_010858 [Perkinsus chesapeaki]